MLHLTKQASQWTTEIPVSAGWYWLRHAAFQSSAGAWHDVHPMIVELVANGTGRMMLFVSGSEWVRPLDDLVVGEWVGPLEVPP